MNIEYTHGNNKNGLYLAEEDWQSLLQYPDKFNSLVLVLHCR